MKLALLGRQAMMGAMAVVLMAGVSVKTFAAENLLNQIKERGTLRVGLEGTYPPFSFQGDDGKLTGFEVEFANELAKTSWREGRSQTDQVGRYAGLAGLQAYRRGD